LLPGRCGQRAADANQEHKAQQHDWRHVTEPDQRGEYRRDQCGRPFQSDQELSLVDDVGERARGQREQEHRQAGGDLDQ
jgi:ribosome-binding protein aMBF1 (putative translation factor)